MTDSLFPGRSVTVFLNGERVSAQPPGNSAEPETLPKWLQSDFKGATEEGEHVFLRVANQAKVGKQKLTVISTVPFDESLLQRIAGKLGRVDLSPDTNIELNLRGEEISMGSAKSGPRVHGDMRKPAPGGRSRLLSGGSIPAPTMPLCISP